MSDTSCDVNLPDKASDIETLLPRTKNGAFWMPCQVATEDPVQ